MGKFGAYVAVTTAGELTHSTPQPITGRFLGFVATVNDTVVITGLTTGTVYYTGTPAANVQELVAVLGVDASAGDLNAGDNINIAQIIPEKLTVVTGAAMTVQLLIEH